MEFEFDEAKSRANLQKHGMDFVSAQVLWSDPEWIEIPARTEDEPRWLVGRIEGKQWSVVVSRRDGRTRIISVRRSLDEEVRIYEGVYEG